MISYRSMWENHAQKCIAQYILIYKRTISLSQISCMKHNEYVSTYTTEMFYKHLELSEG